MGWPKTGLGSILRACPVLLYALSGSTPSAAAEAEVHSDLSAQLYDVMSPYREPVVRRRRYTHALGLDVADIDGDRGFFAPELSFRGRVRLAADLGPTGAELNPQDLERFVPGLEEAPFDVMYAYLEGRHYWDGILGFRLGRQYQIDALGWWSFDGGLLRLDAPGVLGLELYAGFEQRGISALLGSNRYEADGVFRGRRGGLERDEWPVFLEQKRLAPAYGASLQALGLGAAQLRLSYRRIVNRDRVLTSPFPDAEGNFEQIASDRTSLEKAALSVALPWKDATNFDADLVYDLFRRRLSDATLSADWFVSNSTVLGMGYEYFVPTFDGDSIFNWFVQGPSESVELRTSSSLSERLDVALRSGLRFFRVSGDVDELEDGTEASIDHFVFGDVRYRLPASDIHLATESHWGDTGHRFGGNLTTSRRFHEGYYDTLFILSLYDFSDDLRPSRDALSAGYVLGAGVAPRLMQTVRSRLGFQWEHMHSVLVGHRFRVLITLNVTELP